ncbi:MAG: beta/gamma crystallin-related protein, partial [Chloroflexota bacterium]
MSTVFVTVFSDGNYKGRSQALSVGSYNIGDLSIGNDRLSSVRVPSGLQVTLYQHGNFKGATRTYTQDVAFTSDFNDQTSSIKVEEVAIIYEHGKYRGRSQVLPVGQYNIGDLSIGNDRLSSLKVPSGLQVTLYQHGNFKGATRTYTQDTPFASDFNDQTSSIKVEKTGVMATIFENGNYGGRSQSLAVGQYNINDLTIGNDRLSAIKVPVGLRVTLYQHGNFKGTTRTYTSDVAFISDFNDQTSSIKVEEVALTATIFEHGSYRGRSQVLPVGLYNINNLSIGNDRLSSLKVPPGLRVTLYQHGNFQGASRAYTSDVAFTTDFNDQTSSIRVEQVSDATTDSGTTGSSTDNSGTSGGSTESSTGGGSSNTGTDSGSDNNLSSTPPDDMGLGTTTPTGSPPADDVLSDVDFSSLPEPFKSLAEKLQDEINSEVGAAKGDIRLTSSLLGAFDIFGSLYGIDSITLVTIKDAELKVVGEAGVDLTSSDAAGQIGLELSGTTSMFGVDLVTATATFFLDNSGQPSGLIKLTPPEGTSQSWGIGTAFPDVPVVSALKFDEAAMVLSSEDTEDESLSFDINEGFNMYGDIAVATSNDKMLSFIGGLLSVSTIGTHAAVGRTSVGPKYVVEAGVEQDATVIPGSVFNLKLMESEIALEIVGGEPSVSISTNMQITMSWIGAEELYFTGMVKAEAESITGSFTLNKAGSGGQEWRNPFGIPGIVIRQLAVQMGLTYAPPWIDNIGIAGDMKIGTIDGSLAVLVDANDPDQFVLAGQTDEISLLEIMSAMSPPTFVAYQALPSSVQTTMNKIIDVKLTGIDDDGVILNIVPVKTKIGAVEFNDEGITFKGRLIAWGWGAQAHINISDSNILVDASMDAINLANVFRVTGAGSDPNPVFHLQISTSGDPELYVSGKIYLLGISRELLIQATTQGLEFDLTDRFGSILTLNQHYILGDNRISGSGSIDFNLNARVGPIRIAGVTVIDRITLADIGFNASVSMTATTAPSFQMTVSGSFRFQGINISFPTLTIHVAPHDFQAIYDDVISQIADNASDMFKALATSAIQWAQDVAAGVIEFTGEAANVLKNAFNESAQQAANIMKNTMGKSANEIADGMKDAYNLTSDATATVLRGAGYAIDEVGGAVEDAYNLTASGVATALKGAGYAVDEVGNFMKNTGRFAENTINDALKGAGYAAGEVGNFMGDVFGGKWIPHV